MASTSAPARRFFRPEFLPEAVLLAGLGLFFLDQIDAATSAFKSTRAVLIMGTATAAWLAARVALARLVRFATARAAVFSVAALVALSVVVLPAYDNTTVVEAFPGVTSPVPAAAAESALTPATVPGTVSPMPAPVPAAPVPVGPPAPQPVAATAVPATPVPPAPPAAPEPAPAATPAAQPAPPTEETPVAAVPAGPQRLRAGVIEGIDHRASGTAVIYRQPDGRYVVGLEDIDIQPGPDYDLYLVPGGGREDKDGGIRLGDLRGNRGTQFYDVPAGVNLEEGTWTVLVWCQIFGVPVAGATPE